MATSSTGTVTSFSFTTQAHADFYAATCFGLTEDNITSTLLLLDVMANDAGGRSISLYSLDDAYSS